MTCVAQRYVGIMEKVKTWRAVLEAALVHVYNVELKENGQDKYQFLYIQSDI